MSTPAAVAGRVSPTLSHAGVGGSFAGTWLLEGLFPEFLVAVHQRDDVLPLDVVDWKTRVRVVPEPQDAGDHRPYFEGSSLGYPNSGLALLPFNLPIDDLGSGHVHGLGRRHAPPTFSRSIT